MEKEVITSVSPASRAEWRQWLEQNHDKEKAVWLIYFKKNSGRPSVSYTDAVDEALCFGWIDSKEQNLDDISTGGYFSKRKPRSVWSKVNKEKVARLIEENQMTSEGLAAIEVAKNNGSWIILDDAEALLVPEDLMEAFLPFPDAFAYFDTLSPSVKRNLLQWLVLAKKPETRSGRINEIVLNAIDQKRPKPF
ncbi:MAG: YdeI/OmpD-associated family protein [Saprospiraceae bacterium]|nr:YdeI/OmpD-associated family protein [Saprospiraceae bacterium]